MKGNKGNPMTKSRLVFDLHVAEGDGGARILDQS